MNDLSDTLLEYKSRVNTKHKSKHTHKTITQTRIWEAENITVTREGNIIAKTRPYDTRGETHTRANNMINDETNNITDNNAHTHKTQNMQRTWRRQRNTNSNDIS